MRCQICVKNAASFYRSVAGTGRQVPVCVACLSKMSGGAFVFTGDLGGKSDVTMERGSIGNVICPNCGFEFEDYFATGRFGCVGCYKVFHSKIKPIVRKIHGTTRHIGGKP